MLFKFKKSLLFVAGLLILAGSAGYFRQPFAYEALSTRFEDLKNQLSLNGPCGQPLTYTLGSFDGRFGISEQGFLQAVDEAAGIWEKASGYDLFEYSRTGKLEVGLVYDWRQEAIDKLGALGIVIKQDKNSFDTLKAKYAQLYSNYAQSKAALSAAVSDYDRRKAAYEKEVADWNSSGGAPEEDYQRLEQEQQWLNAQVSNLQLKQRNLNFLISNLNAVVDSLNLLAETLNLQVSKYNNIGTQHGSEFEAGVYQSNSGGLSITIFAFADHGELVRSLAHELGHALGLEHSQNSQDIMYRLNQSFNETITSDDLASLKSVCKFTR